VEKPMDGNTIEILLIEDNVSYSSLLRRILSHADIRVETAESLELGIALAQKKSFQAILLDLGLPDSQGLNTFTKFKAHTPNVPIIIFTGSDDERLAARAVQEGAQDYLIKGSYLSKGEAGVNLLVRAIRYAIERHEIQAALQREHDLLERRIIERTTELSNANEQLKRELAERRRYEFIANTSKDPISFIDRNYTYQAVNDGFCLAQNKRREELIGKSVADVWGREAFEVKIKPFIDQALAGYEAQYEGWFNFKTLGYRYFEVFYNPFFDSEHQVTHVVVVSHDETFSENAKDSLRHHNQRLSILREIDHATLVASSPEEIVRVALRHFVRLIPYDRADVLLFSKDGTSLKRMITGGVEGEVKINPTQPAIDDLLQNQELLHGRPHIVHQWQSTSELSPFGGYLKTRGVRSYFTVPLVAEGKMIGVLSVSSFDVDTFLPHHIEDALAISIPLTLLIKNAQLVEQLRNANERLLNLTSHLVSAQEDERRRISLELHDEAGQALIALKVNLAMVQSDLPNELVQAKLQIGEAISVTQQTMDDLHALAQNLRPPAIDAVGLSQALYDYCQRVERQTGIQVSYQDGTLANLASHTQISIFRVVQEALTNIVKHSGATCVEVDLKKDAREIRISVCDNGRGFTHQHMIDRDISRGLGLIGIQERIEALGGSLEVISQAGRGTRLMANIPLQEVT
jgi:PAS domain S-box-containing protein